MIWVVKQKPSSAAVQTDDPLVQVVGNNPKDADT